MCGRYVFALGEEEVMSEAGVNHEQWVGRNEYRPSYNVGPSRSQPVIVMSRAEKATDKCGSANDAKCEKKSGVRELHAMRWGLWPKWSKSREEAYKGSFRTINARSETLKEKNMFKGLVDKQRCVVLSEGYIEWKKLDPAGKKKQAYLITLSNQVCLRMAGLWTIWIDKETGEHIESFTILTTSPNDQMKWLHDRTPVILDNDEDVKLWLDHDTPFSQVERMASTYHGKLKCRAIGPEIGNIKSEGSALIKEVKPTTNAKVNSITNYFTKSPTKRKLEGNDLKHDEKKFKSE
eukprot:CFRG4456T1